jgi:phosphoenolpyruvate carboxykinase (ATP)
VNAALDGDLDSVEYVTEPFFGLSIPTSIEGVPDEILQPRQTWADKDAYDAKAKQLAGMFKANFKNFEDRATPEVVAAGPQV